MDFTLSEDQLPLKDSLTRFVEKEYGFDARRKLVGEGGGFNEANWNTFAEMGWLMVSLPEEHGGLGGTATDLSIIFEELSKALVVEPLLAVVVLAARALIASKPVGAARDLLPALGSGEARPVFAHGETGAYGEVGWRRGRSRYQPVPGGAGDRGAEP